MEHLAIMKKSLGYLEKIISGKKTIESRWHKNRKSPWNRVNMGENIYFKNTGEFTTIKTKVVKILQFENLNSEKIKKILEKYGDKIGIDKDEKDNFFETIKDKKYCILTFLENIEILEKPFDINKKGFGLMSAWISVDNIDLIKKY